MKKYTIVIEETLTGAFEIEANNATEALNVAETRYRNGEISLCPGEVHAKQMAVIDPQSDNTEWQTF